MGLSQLWKDASSLFSEDSAAAQQQQQPAQEPDAQTLYGNSAVAMHLFGGGEDDSQALRDLVQGTREAIDQQMIEDDLREKLHVGEGAGEGQAAVSQEEFDEMVKLYGDIRKGKTNVQFDLSSFGKDKEAAEAFKHGTMDDLSSIMQTPSGRAMLKELAYKEGGPKVELGQSDDKDAPETSPLYQGRDFENLDPEERWALHKEIQDGKSLDTRVSYTPGHSVQTKSDGTVRSDVVLYHELVHAHHFGKGDTAKGGESVGDTHVENSELQATQGWHGDEAYTENRYRKERRAMGEDVPRRETYGGRDVDEGPRDRSCPAW